LTEVLQGSLMCSRNVIHCRTPWWLLLSVCLLLLLIQSMAESLLVVMHMLLLLLPPLLKRLGAACAYGGCSLAVTAAAVLVDTGRPRKYGARYVYGTLTPSAAAAAVLLRLGSLNLVQLMLPIACYQDAVYLWGDMRNCHGRRCSSCAISAARRSSGDDPGCSCCR
jgi:hypothetical protein